MIERTGGPLQIRASALAMMAWPEGVMLMSMTDAGATRVLHPALNVAHREHPGNQLLSAAVAAKSRFGRYT